MIRFALLYAALQNIFKGWNIKTSATYGRRSAISGLRLDIQQRLIQFLLRPNDRCIGRITYERLLLFQVFL